MLVGQPMVFGALVLKVGVPHLALLLSKVSQGLCTLLHVTELELIVVSITSSPPVGRTITEQICSSQQRWNVRRWEYHFHRFEDTHIGLLHSRVRNHTPPPQVREQEPNLVHWPQWPSCLRMSGVSLIQWPLKQCWRNKVRGRKECENGIWYSGSGFMLRFWV